MSENIVKNEKSTTTAWPSYEAPAHPSVGVYGQQGWICPKCGRVNAPWVTTCPCSQIQDMSIPPTCRSCSNHPSNGGSGICHCILGANSVVTWSGTGTAASFPKEQIHITC